MNSPTGVPARLHFDLVTLQLFIATAELGSVTRAAQRVHLAAAAASRRIQELESQIGLPLFQRLPHGMALTEAGRAMLAHARSITHTVLRMQDDAASFRGGQRGVVRLAAPKSAVIQFLPRDILRCAAAVPDVRIDLQELNSQLVQQALQRGVVEIGIYEASLGSIELPTLPYHGDRLVLVVAAGHALAAQASVTLEDILPFDVIGLNEGSALSIALERQADAVGRVLHMRMRVGGFDSMAALVAQDVGVAVMPRVIAEAVAGTSGFARIPIEGDWTARRFVLCHQPRERLSQAAESVLGVLADLQGFPGDTPNANPDSRKQR